MQPTVLEWLLESSLPRVQALCRGALWMESQFSHRWPDLGGHQEHGDRDLSSCSGKLEAQIESKIFTMLVSLSQVLASWLKFRLPSRTIVSLFDSTVYLAGA